MGGGGGRKPRNQTSIWANACSIAMLLCWHVSMSCLLCCPRWHRAPWLPEPEVQENYVSRAEGAAPVLPMDECRFLWLAPQTAEQTKLRAHGQRLSLRFDPPAWLSAKLQQHELHEAPPLQWTGIVEVVGLVQVSPGRVLDEMCILNVEEALQHQCEDGATVLKT